MTKGIVKEILPNIKTKLNTFSQKGKWQNIVIKVLSSNLFWLLFISAVFRIIYYSCYINTINPDSDSYLNYHANILIGQVDCYRTPLYPYFIKIIRFFSGVHYIRYIVMVQSAISFVTIILFYKIGKSIFRITYISTVSTLIYGILPSIINYDKCIMTESLSISAIIIFLYFILNYLKKPTVFKAVIYSMSVFFLIMLRPSFVYLLLLMFVFWVMRIVLCRTELFKSFSGLVAIITCALLIFCYAQLNYIYNGYKGITAISNFNQVRMIIDYGFYKNNFDPQITKTINESLNNKSRMSWIYIDKADPQITEKIKYEINTETRWGWMPTYVIFEKYSYQRIKSFANYCLINNIPAFLKKSLKKTYDLGGQSTSSVFAESKENILNDLVFIIYSVLSISFFSVYLLLIIDVIYIFWILIRLKQKPWLKIIIWTIIAAQLAGSIIGGPTEPQRLFTEALPFVVLLLFSYFDTILYSMGNFKLNSA